MMKDNKMMKKDGEISEETPDEAEHPLTLSASIPQQNTPVCVRNTS